MDDDKAEASGRLPERVNLGGMMCRVQEAEGMVVFSSVDNVWSTWYRLTFERRAGCWYVGIEASGGGAMVSDIARAFDVIREVYGGNFEYNGRPIRPEQP